MGKIWGFFRAAIEFIRTIADFWWLLSAVIGTGTMLFGFYADSTPWEIFFLTMIGIFLFPCIVMALTFYKYHKNYDEGQNKSTDLRYVVLGTESFLTMITPKHSESVYFVIERIVVTNSSPNSSFNLDMFLMAKKPDGNSLRIDPLQQSLLEWEKLKEDDKVLKMNFLSFPFTLRPKTFKAGYIAFRFANVQSFQRFACGGLGINEFSGNFTTHFCAPFDTYLVVRDLETQAENFYTFTAGNIGVYFGDDSKPHFNTHRVTMNIVPQL